MSAPPRRSQRAGNSPRPAKIARVRTIAQDAMRGGRWWTLLDLEKSLRADAEFWRDLWAPSLAIAAHKVGLPSARDRLDEAIEKGFHQVDLFEPELSRAFGRDEDWDAVLERARANTPGPPLRITAWPEPGLTAPLRLETVASHREAQLRRRLPSPTAGAWDTARAVLAWTNGLWRHANARINAGDSVDILEQVANGARYSCVEYSIVLAQSLNALRIPARRADLRRGDYHDGVGKGHAVTEAWIDDLDAWVLLDGQHGSYWVDEDARPLSLPQLQARERPARPVSIGPRDGVEDVELWFAYFRHASVTGAAWAPKGFVPTFQGSYVVETERLLHDASDAYPRLSDIAVAVTSLDGAPAVRVVPTHPYAVGGTMVGAAAHPAKRVGPNVGWELDLTPGEHRADLAALTPYGALASHELRWTAS
ncbi:transglutaminase-like domain-containing protein [Glycomyces sp. L485]|uniref:transglutaminase-like domain-containing protein n=1 Tax=Glycomyces sp. L485 TaxID=2909235 RepID=UPI001F4B9160|nr:transglutaminase-like domain-containing protein [Glycomyces sp. L485]MCH7231470.1 transglutaminase-like domain-containing protein [Glycomyces sp. L485]